MCLSVVKRLPIKQKIGWKVFIKKRDWSRLKDWRSRSFRAIYSSQFYTINYQSGMWYRRRRRENEPICLSSSGQSYESGFHIFVHRRAAYKHKESIYTSARLVVKKVQFGKVVATGRQYGVPIIVAKSMKIL